MKPVRMEVFKIRFHELRGDKSQDAFADELGISRPTVGFYENGTRLPDALTLSQIATKCNVSTDWLLGLSETKQYQGTLTEVCNYTGLSEETARRLHLYFSSYRDYCSIIDGFIGQLSSFASIDAVLNFIFANAADKLNEKLYNKTEAITEKVFEDIAKTEELDFISAETAEIYSAISAEITESSRSLYQPVFSWYDFIINRYEELPSHSALAVDNISAKAIANVAINELISKRFLAPLDVAGEKLATEIINSLNFTNVIETAVNNEYLEYTKHLKEAGEDG